MLEQLAERLERLERRHRRLKYALGASVLLAFGCGAASTTAQYRKVTSHDVAIFGTGEQGEVITMDRDEAGGRFVLRDHSGKVRIALDATGIRTFDGAGAEKWSSAR
jgi:hypothetical protein